MTYERPDPAEAFEGWLLRRVGEAVEAGEVSADLLSEIHAAIVETRGRPPEERDALALMELAERVQLPVDRLTELLGALQAQPTMVQERFLRRFVEAWLIRQREVYEADHRGGNED